MCVCVCLFVGMCIRQAARQRDRWWMIALRAKCVASSWRSAALSWHRDLRLFWFWAMEVALTCTWAQGVPWSWLQQSKRCPHPCFAYYGARGIVHLISVSPCKYIDCDGWRLVLSTPHFLVSEDSRARTHRDKQTDRQTHMHTCIYIYICIRSMSGPKIAFFESISGPSSVLFLFLKNLLLSAGKSDVSKNAKKCVFNLPKSWVNIWCN